jgi:hypothetical protein
MNSDRVKRTRTKVAWALLAVSIVGWPVTSVLQWMGIDIFEQVMLALSWLAVIIVCADFLTTSQVSEEQNGS